MKTSKFKFLIPMLAIVFAVTTAFSTTDSVETNSLTSVKGYIDAPSPCMESIDCSLIEGPVCTNGLFGPQAFAKNSPNSTICPVVVYRPQ